jgi:hypothetical protein
LIERCNRYAGIVKIRLLVKAKQNSVVLIVGKDKITRANQLMQVGNQLGQLRFVS